MEITYSASTKAPRRRSIPTAAPRIVGSPVPATGSSGSDVAWATGGMVLPGVVEQTQFVAFRQDGFLQIPFEQTILLVQSVLSEQESPQESGGTGVAVGLAVAVGVAVLVGVGDGVGVT